MDGGRQLLETHGSCAVPWFDVTVVNPLAPTYLNAAQEVGGAEEKRSAAKDLKYKALSQERILLSS